MCVCVRERERVCERERETFSRERERLSLERTVKLILHTGAPEKGRGEGLPIMKLAWTFSAGKGVGFKIPKYAQVMGHRCFSPFS